jgi:hypothetical protein
MGFGPKARSVDAGVEAVQNLIALLYPERATPEVLELLGASTRALLTAKAALTFENIARFWEDPEWRAWIISRWEAPLPGPWDNAGTHTVSPAELNQHFGWLIADRIAAGRESDDSL